MFLFRSVGCFSWFWLFSVRVGWYLCFFWPGCVLFGLRWAWFSFDWVGFDFRNLLFFVKSLSVFHSLHWKTIVCLIFPCQALYIKILNSNSINSFARVICILFGQAAAGPPFPFANNE